VLAVGGDRVAADDVLEGGRVAQVPAGEVIADVGELAEQVRRGTDSGIWRRIAKIPFLESFVGRDDKELQEKLASELPGILN